MGFVFLFSKVAYFDLQFPAHLYLWRSISEKSSKYKKSWYPWYTAALNGREPECRPVPLQIKELGFCPERQWEGWGGGLPGFQHVDDVISRCVLMSLLLAQGGAALRGPRAAYVSQSQGDHPWQPGAWQTAEGLTRRDGCKPHCWY